MGGANKHLKFIEYSITTIKISKGFEVVKQTIAMLRIKMKLLAVDGSTWSLRIILSSKSVEALNHLFHFIKFLRLFFVFAIFF